MTEPLTDDTVTDEQIRAVKGAVHSIRATLRSAITAKLDDKTIERIRAVAFELEAARDAIDEMISRANQAAETIKIIKARRARKGK